MKKKMSKNIVLIGLFALTMSSAMPLAAQEAPTRKQQAVAMLKKYAGKANTSIKKLIACLRGDENTCTKEDIKKARFYTGIISAALVIILSTGGIATYLRWKKNRGEDGEGTGNGEEEISAAGVRVSEEEREKANPTTLSLYTQTIKSPRETEGDLIENFQFTLRLPGQELDKVNWNYKGTAGTSLIDWVDDNFKNFEPNTQDKLKEVGATISKENRGIVEQRETEHQLREQQYEQQLQQKSEQKKREEDERLRKAEAKRKHQEEQQRKKEQEQAEQTRLEKQRIQEQLEKAEAQRKKEQGKARQEERQRQAEEERKKEEEERKKEQEEQQQREKEQGRGFFETLWSMLGKPKAESEYKIKVREAVEIKTDLALYKAENPEKSEAIDHQIEELTTKIENPEDIKLLDQAIKEARELLKQ